jgi:release factor glutamine methyltransferase
MVPFTYDTVVVYDNTSHQGVCPGETYTLSGQLKTAAHVYFISLCQLALPLLLFLIMLQNHATLGDIRKYLQKEVSQTYSGGEINALVHMIMEYCGYPTPGAILNPQHQPGTHTVAQINEIVADIHTHRPIQYILGETRFLDMTIHIDENALIPRPETEELVYRIIHSTEHPPLQILDLCTGSGCIALALKKEFPKALVSGLDNSIRALELARRNSEMNQLEVNWIRADILSPETTFPPVKYDLVVCNPPYVLMSEKAQMDRNVLDFEPHGALFVEDDDPLVFYSAVARLSPEILSENGTIWLEINERFGREVSILLEDSGFNLTTIYKDIHEKERFIQARI